MVLGLCLATQLPGREAVPQWERDGIVAGVVQIREKIDKARRWAGPWLATRQVAVPLRGLRPNQWRLQKIRQIDLCAGIAYRWMPATPMWGRGSSPTARPGRWLGSLLAGVVASLLHALPGKASAAADARAPGRRRGGGRGAGRRGGAESEELWWGAQEAEFRWASRPWVAIRVWG